MTAATWVLIVIALVCALGAAFAPARRQIDWLVAAVLALVLAGGSVYLPSLLTWMGLVPA